MLLLYHFWLVYVQFPHTSCMHLYIVIVVTLLKFHITSSVVSVAFVYLFYTTNYVIVDLYHYFIENYTFTLLPTYDSHTFSLQSIGWNNTSDVIYFFMILYISKIGATDGVKRSVTIVSLQLLQTQNNLVCKNA